MNGEKGMFFGNLKKAVSVFLLCGIILTSVNMQRIPVCADNGNTLPWVGDDGQLETTDAVKNGLCKGKTLNLYIF